MNQKILSMQDLENIDSALVDFNGRILDFDVRFDGLLKLFENEEVVQSFYRSGFFGSAEKDRLYDLKNAVQRYVDVISNGPDSLVVTLKKFVREQKDLVSMNTRGYSITESRDGRRVGNRG